MISFITGKPGGGKGLLSVQQVIDELRFGKRPIITNLPLRVAAWVNGSHQPMLGLRAYLQREYGTDFNVQKRVFVLDDDDAGSFYLWRVTKEGLLQKAEANIKRVQKDGIEEERVMDFDTTLAVETGSVFYVIDEAWKFYGSRNWQKTGEGMLFYSSQHRKFGDDVLIVTQHTKQIDPAILRVAQDFWTVTNHGNLTFGFFRQPSVFHVRIFDSPPTGAAMTPMSRKLFRLDKSGMAQCYDTSAGVGISGRAVADLGARKRGLPAWAMVVFAVVAILFLFKGFSYLPKLIALPFHKQQQKLVQKHSEQKMPGISQNLESSTNLTVLEKRSCASDTNDVECVGWLRCGQGMVGQYVQVMLSDGRIADSRYGEVQRIDRWKVRAFDEDFKIRLPVPTAGVGVIQDSRSIEPVIQQSSVDLSPALPVVGEIPRRETAAPPMQGVQSRMQKGLSSQLTGQPFVNR